MLLMKKAYFDAIRRGEKRTTLRWWTYARVRAGSVHLVPGLGRVRIDGVTTMQPGALRAAHGFATLRELRAALAAIYGTAAGEGKKLYLVRFTLQDVD